MFRIQACAKDTNFRKAVTKTISGIDWIVKERLGHNASDELCNDIIVHPEGLDGGPDWTDPAVQTSISAAVAKDCGTFGTAIAAAGGLPELKGD